MSLDIRRLRRLPAHRRRELELARADLAEQMLARRGVCFLQGDQSIANQTGASFRSDLNNELQALVTQSSGTSAPATTYAHQIWADTTANVLKKRNAANTGWLVYRTLDEAFVPARSSNTILGVSDVGKIISATSSFTQTITAAATLGDGWWISYRNSGTGSITLDPNGSETIDGATTLVLAPGEACTLICNGSNFVTANRSRNVYIHGADVASAATLNLDTATGDCVDVTGTTTITAITLADGKECTVRFTGILTLTHGASLVLPGGQSIVTSAGDFAIFRGYSGGVVRCVVYTFAVAGSTGEVKLATGTVSSQATLDIDMSAFTAYRNKRLVFNLIPATDGVGLQGRVSADAVTYDSGASNYSNRVDDEDNVAVQASFTSDATLFQISANNVIGNGAAEGCNGEIHMYDTINAARWPQFLWEMSYIGSNGTPQIGFNRGVGARRAAQQTKGFRLFVNSGNLASGFWTLYADA